jgi:hypothetical protein
MSSAYETCENALHIVQAGEELAHASERNVATTRAGRRLIMGARCKPRGEINGV